MRTWHLKELAYKVLRNGSRTDLDLNLTLARRGALGYLFYRALSLGFLISRMGLK